MKWFRHSEWLINTFDFRSVSKMIFSVLLCRLWTYPGFGRDFPWMIKIVKTVIIQLFVPHFIWYAEMRDLNSVPLCCCVSFTVTRYTIIMHHWCRLKIMRLCFEMQWCRKRTFWYRSTSKWDACDSSLLFRCLVDAVQCGQSTCCWDKCMRMAHAVWMGNTQWCNTYCNLLLRVPTSNSQIFEKLEFQHLIFVVFFFFSRLEVSSIRIINS